MSYLILLLLCVDSGVMLVIREYRNNSQIVFPEEVNRNQEIPLDLIRQLNEVSSVEEFYENFLEPYRPNTHRGVSALNFEGVNAMLPLSPQTFQQMFPKDIRYLTAYGTIRYPRRVVPTMDPKRIKHHSLITLRDRFCQLYIGFECDEHVISVTNCKIWTIKYSVSSRVTPRNLLKSFNEVESN